MKRTRPPVQVVEFVDPFLKRASRSSPAKQRKLLEAKASKKKAYEKEKSSKDEIDSLFDRKNVFEEVMELGASQLDKKNKKAYKKMQLSKLGCKVDEKQKMPFKMYQDMKKRNKAKEAKKLKEEIESGVITGRVTPKKKSSSRRQEDFQRKQRNLYGKTTSNHVRDVDSPSVGRFKDGLLRIRRHEL